jgi:aspartate/methionine/tyrosine aminotransferase
VDQVLFESGLIFDLDLSHGTNRLQPPQLFRRLLEEGAQRWGLLSEYTAPLGEMTLRDHVAKYETALQPQGEVSTSQVAITNGAAEGLALAFRYCARNGARHVLSCGPQFPIIFTSSLHAGLCHTSVIGSETHGLVPTLEQVLDGSERLPVDVLLVTQPGNPAGDVLTESELRRIVDAMPRLRWLIVDRVCGDLSPRRDESLPELRHVADDYDVKTVLIDSFSKRRSCPGARLGYLIAEQPMIDWCASFLMGRGTSRVAEFAAVEDLRIATMWVRSPTVLSPDETDYVDQIFAGQQAIQENWHHAQAELRPLVLTPAQYGQNSVCSVRLERPMTQLDLCRFFAAEWHLGSYPMRCFLPAFDDVATNSFTFRLTLSAPTLEFARTIERMNDALAAL